MAEQPTPAVGQHWRSQKLNVVRRIVSASDPWSVIVESITTGQRTSVLRTHEWGPLKDYAYVPKSPAAAAKELAEREDVHIRFSPGEGLRLTYCLKPLEARPGMDEPDLISTTVEHLSWWRARRVICPQCDFRLKDAKALLGEFVGAA